MTLSQGHYVAFIKADQLISGRRHDSQSSSDAATDEAVTCDVLTCDAATGDVATDDATEKSGEMFCENQPGSEKMDTGQECAAKQQPDQDVHASQAGAPLDTCPADTVTQPEIDVNSNNNNNTSDDTVPGGDDGGFAAFPSPDSSDASDPNNNSDANNNVDLVESMYTSNAVAEPVTDASVPAAGATAVAQTSAVDNDVPPVDTLDYSGDTETEEDQSKPTKPNMDISSSTAWIECDDEKISELTQAEFDKIIGPKSGDTPYMLFYRRKALQGSGQL